MRRVAPGPFKLMLVSVALCWALAAIVGLFVDQPTSVRAVLVCAAAATVPIVLAIVYFRGGRRELVRMAREERGLCPSCGYDLRAHAPGERCPECGTPAA